MEATAQEIFNFIMQDVPKKEYNTPQEKKDHSMIIFEMKVQNLIHQTKESERVLEIWGEDKVREYGYNVEKAKKTIADVKAYCKLFGYKY